MHSRTLRNHRAAVKPQNASARIVSVKRLEGAKLAGYWR
jgi:hypothetical protein